MPLALPVFLTQTTFPVSFYQKSLERLSMVRSLPLVYQNTLEPFYDLLSLVNAIIMHIHLAFNPITSSSTSFRVVHHATVLSQSSSHQDKLEDF